MIRTAATVAALLSLIAISPNLQAQTPQTGRTISFGFADIGFVPPPGAHDGRVFVLSQNYPETLPPPDAAGADWMRWFRNIAWSQSFDGNDVAVNLDFSPQLAKSIQNCIDYLNETTEGQFAGEYWSLGYRIRRNVVMQ